MVHRFVTDRPVNSVIHPAGLPINASTIEVLRRPVESGLNSAIRMVDQSVEVRAVSGPVPDRLFQCVQREVGLQRS